MRGANAHSLFKGRVYGQIVRLQHVVLPVTRGKCVCARLGAEATDYGLRATRKPTVKSARLGKLP